MTIVVLDHAPLIIDAYKRPLFAPRPYKFESMWLLHSDCKEVIKTRMGQQSARLFGIQAKTPFCAKTLQIWDYVAVAFRLQRGHKTRMGKQSARLFGIQVANKTWKGVKAVEALEQDFFLAIFNRQSKTLHSNFNNCGQIWQACKKSKGRQN